MSETKFDFDRFDREFMRRGSLRQDRSTYGYLCAEAVVAGADVLARHYAEKCLQAERDLAASLVAESKAQEYVK